MDVCVCVCMHTDYIYIYIYIYTQIFASHYSYGYLETSEDMMRRKNELGATLLRILFTTKQSSFNLICMFQH